MALSFKIARKFIKRLIAKRGMIKAIIEYAEFATSLTPSKKDDAVVAKVKKALENAEDEVKKVVKKVKAVKKALKG
jgi:Asp-tRNA(Asn)/Glu-tRNA(Gln) amidotransferase B subunit